MDYESLIINALLKHPEYLVDCCNVIKPSFLKNKAIQLIYRIICIYYKEHSDLVTFDIVADRVDSMNIPSKLKLSVNEVLLSSSNNEDVKIENFRYAIRCILDQQASDLMVNKMGEAVESINKGDIKAAKDIFKKNVIDLDDLDLKNAPVENIRDTVNESKILYEKSVNKKSALPIATGFNIIDELTNGGLYPGQLWLAGAFTGEGKTQFCKEVAYNAVIWGHNVLFISLEMSIQEIKWLLETRHSHNFKEGGLLYNEIVCGLLSDSDKNCYYNTLEDWESNIKYGKLIIWQPPVNAVVSDVGSRLKNIDISGINIDLIIVDYLELLKPDRFRDQYRIEIKDNFEVLKRIALTAKDGDGVRILTAHQTSRIGRDKAEKRGYYNLNDLAETAGAERSVNLAMGILRTDEMMQQHELKINVMKNRSGPICKEGFHVLENFAHSMMADINTKK